METAELRRAYEELLREVTLGGFGPPDGDGLNAEQVLAHLVANDELLTDATEAVLVGSPYAYYELDTIHRPQLDDLVARYGGLDGLTDRLRVTSDQLCGLTEQVGDRVDALVQTRLREAPRLDIDEALPWGRVLDIHGRVHLPAHADDLCLLREPAGD
ncbi:hypothetical protein BDK92_4775 [Micromonospora pisi]|uniref:DinB family protein n=1 Tax=Micromonospora pisi TaxID=589240 RepID=A0A495JN96_9ACTN|nr:hypothetical protein [Micromonospora pisi]RKR90403.1 hypothetical protein BDK92_4775 [Micromonospora pisi]